MIDFAQIKHTVTYVSREYAKRITSKLATPAYRYANWRQSSS